MKPIENRNHHYVPQLLLRNFAIEGRETLFAFDKWEGKRFQVAIKNAAAEGGYNSYKTNEDSGCVEDFFTEIESAAAPFFQAIVSDRRMPRLAEAERITLAKFTIAQKLRSKNHRAVYSQIGELVRDLAQREGTPEFKKWVGEIDQEEEKRSLLIDIEKSVNELVPHLLNKDIVLFSAQEDYPLLIGDSPVMLDNTMNRSALVGTLGLASTGIEIYLPLSPTLTISFMCPTIGMMTRELIYRLGKEAGDFSISYQEALHFRRPVQLAKTNIDFMNSGQVCTAERFVYSGTSNFDHVEKLIRHDPSHRKGARITMNYPTKAAS